MIDELESDGTFTELLDVEPDPDIGHRVEVRGDDGAIGSVDRVLLAAPAGAHLFGTADDRSDRDLQGVYVETLDRIILGRDRDRLRFRTSGGPEAASGPDDVDATFWELRRFVRDVLDGQPHAVELLHCPRSLELVATELWREIRGARGELLSSRLDAFVRYCRARAAKYGGTTRRLETLEDALEILEAEKAETRIRTVADRLAALDTVDIVDTSLEGRTEPVQFVRIAERRFELQAPVRQARESLRSLRDEYAGRGNGGPRTIDWKDVSHAYRIALELRELRRTGDLEFPLERADYLRRVKRGDVSRECVERELPPLIEEALAADSDLPDRPNESYWENRLPDLYRDLFAGR